MIAKPESTVGGAVPRDPLLVVGGAGKGRTVAFAPDFAPHWAPPEFVGWSHYDALWVSITSWASGERTGG